MRCTKWWHGGFKFWNGFNLAVVEATKHPAGACWHLDSGGILRASPKRSLNMPGRIRSCIKFLIAVCLVVSFCLVEGDAQTRRKKRSRRRAVPAAPKPVITNPPIAPPDATQPTAPTESNATGDDVKIISQADSTQDPAQPAAKKAVVPTTTNEKEEMQQTITTLSNQVNKLNDKLSQMQEDDRYQLDMERLTRAEQRAEQLRSQLMDIEGKIADFQARLEQIDFALQPENIESATAGYGSTRPEQAREARKKQLEGEKARVTAQLRLAESSKTRLENAVASADTEVDMLRTKLNQRREQMDAQPVTTDTPKPRKP
jgi:phage shock protein A